MTPKITYNGFTPADDVIFVVAEVFEKLQDASPYESHIEATVARDDASYVMQVTVYHAGGKFEYSAKGKSLNDLIFRTVEPVLAEIKNWSQNREFSETSRTEWESTFSLPFADWPEENPESRLLSTTNEESKPLNVLIVDDDIESVIPLRQCLQKLGCSTSVVTSGFEAIHEILSGEKNYDVIFMDWQMPEMSGKQALLNAQKVITHAPSVKDHWNNFQLPVIVFSSCPAHEVQIPECRDFKFIDHWEKSIPFQNLFEKVTDTFLELKKVPLET